MKNKKKFFISGIIFIISAIVIFVPLASNEPDGLEKTADILKFEGKQQNYLERIYKFFSDYTFPWIKNQTISNIVAGIIGVIITLCFSYIIFTLIRKKQMKKFL